MIKGNKKINRTLIYIISALTLVGIITLASASAPFSQKNYGSPFYILFHQIIYALIPGIIILIIMTKIPISFLRKYAFHILILSLILLGAVFIPGIGKCIGGAKRWISLGFISFQPSEFLKLSFIIYFSAWLDKRLKKKSEDKELFLGFIFIIGLISIFLIKQPDISTLLVIAVIAFVMYFASRTPFWHSIAIATLGIGAFLVLARTSFYRMNRILVFLHPELDPLGKGYQIKQSMIAIGSGGLRGLGLGMSRQKFGFIPNPISDTIFSIFAEETGFIGAIFLILIFLAFLFQGLRITKLLKDNFMKLMALGITIWITIQAFVNISSMVRLLPLTGIPLPLISFGGSAIIAELAGLGILLNISKYT